VALKVFTCYIEDVNEHLDIFEDVFPLALEELLHEKILTAAIPKRQHKIPQESHARLGHINSKRDSVGITSQVVGEDDRSHRCLTGAYSAHEEHFLDLRFFSANLPSSRDLSTGSCSLFSLHF